MRTFVEASVVERSEDGSRNGDRGRQRDEKPAGSRSSTKRTPVNKVSGAQN
jgi:hypothetical protein